jgi:hypothetical protein
MVIINRNRDYGNECCMVSTSSALSWEVHYRKCAVAMLDKSTHNSFESDIL